MVGDRETDEGGEGVVLEVARRGPARGELRRPGLAVAKSVGMEVSSAGHHLYSSGGFFMARPQTRSARKMEAMSTRRRAVWASLAAATAQ
jgi:hypothetical protein